MPGVGDTQAEIGQNLYPAGSHQVPARLVAREGRLVGERHPRAGPGQHQRGDAAGRPGADHHRIEAAAHRAATITNTTRTATSGTFWVTRVTGSKSEPSRSSGQKAPRRQPLRSSCHEPGRQAIRKHFTAHEHACLPTASGACQQAGHSWPSRR